MVAVRLDTEMISQIHAEARKNHVSFVYVIREAVRNYLK
jgi:predicted transcriptional regulator